MASSSGTGHDAASLDGLRGMASVALHEALDKIDSDPLGAALAAGLAKSCLAIEAANHARTKNEEAVDA